MKVILSGLHADASESAIIESFSPYERV